MNIKTLELKSALRTFQCFIGKPLGYRHRVEEQGRYEDEETPEGLVKMGRFVKTHDIVFHELRSQGIEFWFDPTDKKWRWSIAVLHRSFNRMEPDDVDIVDMPESFDQLHQLVRDICVTLYKQRLDDFLVGEGEYLWSVQSEQWAKEYSALDS